MVKTYVILWCRSCLKSNIKLTVLMCMNNVHMVKQELNMHQPLLTNIDRSLPDILNRTKLNIRINTTCNKFIKSFNQQCTWQLKVEENLTVLNVDYMAFFRSSNMRSVNQPFPPLPFAFLPSPPLSPFLLPSLRRRRLQYS